MSDSAELVQQLHNVRVFRFVAGAKSIAQASDELFKAPSAVSRSISDLEKAIGVQLFERNVRGIMLNEYGQVVRLRAERIGAELNQAAAELARLKSSSGSTSASAIEHLLFNGRKLELLTSLVDSRKISTAADQLQMTQSGASMSLSRIESALGAQLFRRGMHGMIATDAANRLAMRAKRVFSELRHMMADVSAVKGTLSGNVVVGALPLGRTYLLPMAVAAVTARYPGIQVTFVETPFEQLMSNLQSGNVDAIIGVPRSQQQDPSLIVEPLFKDRLTVLTRADHRLAGRKGVGLAELMSEQWILPWGTSPSRTLFKDNFFQAGLTPPTPRVESADLAVIRQLLIASDMLALASARQLRFEIQSGTLVELDVDLGDMSRQVSLITRDGAMPSPATLALFSALREQVLLDTD